MSFYDLDKARRAALVKRMSLVIADEIKAGSEKNITMYFSDPDTYIRKSAYISVGRQYQLLSECRKGIIKTLTGLLKNTDFKVRQTSINAAGEIGMKDFKVVRHFFDQGLFDEHHAVRNAVIGSVKKMGQKNPVPVLAWAREYLHHNDKEIRREICHGIELRGRTHPGDILPLLRELQFDKTARVRNTLVHVIGQIAYKKGCLPLVIDHLNNWENKDLVRKAINEIIDVHDRYRNFAALSQKQAIKFIKENLEPAS